MIPVTDESIRSFCDDPKTAKTAPKKTKSSASERNVTALNKAFGGLSHRMSQACVAICAAKSVVSPDIITKSSVRRMNSAR
ncbi:hypothetical protein C9890_0195 [Perkinsus sp. BL_2016]|nr:hypothetical protein C9890_0195 [Perkinsus sp. BL_2016]